MIPHFYVNSLVLLPPRKWWVARKKRGRPHSTYTVPAIHCTGTYYVLLIPLSVGVFPIFESVQRIYFWENSSTISVCDLSHVGTGTNFSCVIRKGNWPLHLRSDKNLYVLPKHLAFEDGWVPCVSKTVSTRAHTRKVQAYLRKTTLQVELCS